MSPALRPWLDMRAGPRSWRLGCPPRMPDFVHASPAPAVVFAWRKTKESSTSTDHTRVSPQACRVAQMGRYTAGRRMGACWMCGTMDGSSTEALHP